MLWAPLAGAAPWPQHPALHEHQQGFSPSSCHICSVFVQTQPINIGLKAMTPKLPACVCPCSAPSSEHSLHWMGLEPFLGLIHSKSLKIDLSCITQENNPSWRVLPFKQNPWNHGSESWALKLPAKLRNLCKMRRFYFNYILLSLPQEINEREK